MIQLHLWSELVTNLTADLTTYVRFGSGDDAADDTNFDPASATAAAGNDGDWGARSN